MVQRQDFKSYKEPIIFKSISSWSIILQVSIAKPIWLRYNDMASQIWEVHVKINNTDLDTQVYNYNLQNKKTKDDIKRGTSKF